MGLNRLSIAKSGDRLRMGVHELSIEFFDFLAMLPLGGVYSLRWEVPTGGLDMMSVHNRPMVAGAHRGRSRCGIFWLRVRGQGLQQRHGCPKSRRS